MLPISSYGYRNLVFLVCLMLYLPIVYLRPPYVWCYAFGIVVYFLTCIALCVLYFAGTRQGRALGLLSWSAVVIWYSYAKCYEILGLQQGTAVTNDFGDCLYFSAVTWTTLGYGDLLPTPAARAYAGTQAVIGIVFMGMYVSLLTSYLSNRQRADSGQIELRRLRRRAAQRRLLVEVIREYRNSRRRFRRPAPPARESQAPEPPLPSETEVRQ